MVTKIDIKDMNKDTTLEVFSKYLDQIAVDKVERRELTAFEQGRKIGFLEAVDFMNKLCKS